MDFQKISGWVLLLIGLAILGWSIYTSFNIFTAKAVAPEIFKIENKAQNSSSATVKMPSTPAEVQKQMESIVSEQIRQLIPTELIANLLNLISWAIFASFLIFAGFQIASLGVKLIRK